MGKPSPTQTDQAQQVVTGSFTAVGPGQGGTDNGETNAFQPFGAFNVALWNQINTSLTTTNGSASATVTSGTGLVAGQTIVSVNVPAGTTVGAITGTAVTLAFPPGTTSANVVSGTDSAALFIGGTFSATVNLERSFDGGVTWLTVASYSSTATNTSVTEYERGVYYRLNCTVYSSGTLEYRLSITGRQAMSIGGII